MSPTVTVDVGTTSVKLAVLDTAGEVTASDSRPTPTLSDDIGEVYDVPALQGMIVDFLRGLAPDVRVGVARISLTGVGESGGLVDEDLTLRSPMILWHDHRGAVALAALGPEQRSRIYRVTGLPVNANYALSKAAWAVDRLRGREGCAGNGTVQWLNIAEYLAAWLTGIRWSEPSLASRTMALDLERGEWSPEVCALLGVSVDIFPRLRPAGHGSPLSSEALATTGLARGVLVHIAGHDHMVGSVGAQLAQGELLDSTGTTEGLLTVGVSPRLDGQTELAKLANGIDPAGGRFTLFASIPTGGAAFAALQSMLKIDAARLSAMTDTLSERYLDGLVDLDAVPLVLPWWRGSPPPTKDASARAVVAGLGPAMTPDDIVFGTFLGLVLQFRDALGLFGSPVECVKVIGPAARNRLWLQLKADLLDIALSVSGVEEVVSRGAQALATGAEMSWADCRPATVRPDETRHRRLVEWAERIRPRWDHLKAMPA